VARVVQRSAFDVRWTSNDGGRVRDPFDESPVEDAGQTLHSRT